MDKELSKFVPKVHRALRVNSCRVTNGQYARPHWSKGGKETKKGTHNVSSGGVALLFLPPEELRMADVEVGVAATHNTKEAVSMNSPEQPLET